MDAVTRLSRERDRLMVLLVEAIRLLEDSHPPSGGRTDKFLRRAKKALRG